MTAKIITLQTITTLDLEPDRVLQAAIDENLQSVVVLGYDQNGEEYFASSVASWPEIVWLLERAKMKLLQIGSDDV